MRVNFHEHMRLRDQRPARALTPAQPANFIRWRDEWRAEVAARLSEANDNGFAEPKSAVLPRPARSGRSNAAKFATAITRNEFGRFYWDKKLARQLAQALAAGAAKKAGTSKPASPQR
jgi:hypothetical protein